MALVIKDRVKQTTTTTGTGTLTLNGTVDGFQTFAAALSDGDTTYYALLEPSTNEWEVGLGTWTEGSSLLARTTVLASSNSGSAVNLTAQAEVFISQPAGKAAFFSADGDLELTRDPQTALQAATKEYVDTIAAAGLHYHDPVRVEQEGNLSATYDNGTAGVGATLTNNSTQAALVIDGVTLSTNDRVLIYEQTDATQNGVYTVTDTGSASTNWVLTRSTDTDSYAPSDPNSFGKGDAFFVLEGNAGAGELYVMNTSGTITFGTTNITFTVIAETAVYAAGNGLTLTGTTFAVGAGTGVTVNANDVAIGQSVGTGDTVTFATVNAALTGNVTGNVTGDVTGNADTATALETARNIGGVSFDGTASINLPGVNTTGNQDTTGNAATATAWETGRTISLTGDVTGSVTGVDGSGNATIAATIAANSVALGTDTTGDYVSTITSGNYLTGGVTGEGSTPTLNVDATPNNTASKVVARDASGNFSAGTVTAALSGNASTASALATGRSIALSGDVSGSTTFDGSGNVTITTTVADDSHNHVISNVDGLQTALDGKQASGTYNTIIGTDSDINTSGSTIIDNIFVTDGVITSMGTRTLTLADLGYTGATNANYITNNNQLTNGAGYTTYTANQSVNTSSSPTFAEVYNNGWFRNNQSGEGLYNQTNGMHLVSYDNTAYAVYSNQTAARLDIKTSGNVLRGSLYGNTSNEIGILDSDGNWAIRHVRDSRTEFLINNSEKMELNNGGILLHDGSLAEDYDALSGTSPTCNVDNGGAFSLTMSGNTTFTFSGAASGYIQGFVLQLTGNGSTVTWPSSVKWAGGTAPDAPASGETDVLVFHTRDGGSNWYGVLASDAAA